MSTCVLVFAAALTCRGATDTWVGNAPPIFNPNTLWTAPGNWASGTVPPNGADLRFGTGFSSGTNVVVFGNRTIGTLTIDTTTPFSFVDAGGDSLTLTQSLTRTATSDGTQTVGVPVSLASSTSAQSWTLGGAGGLKMTAFLGGFGQQLSLLGGGSVSFSGGATIGTLHVDNATATIDGGSYEFQGAQTAVSIGVAGVASSLTVQGAAVVNAAGRNGYTQIAGTDTVASKLTVQGSRTTWFNGFEMDVGSAGQGQVNVQSGASVGGASGGPFLMVVGAGPGGNGRLTASSGGVVLDSVGILAVDDTSVGTAIITGAGSMWQNSQELHIGGSDSSGQAGGTASLLISNGGSVSAGHVSFWRSDAAVSIDGGTLSTGGLVTRDSTATGSTISLQANAAGGVPALAITGDVAGENSDYLGSILGGGTLRKTGRSTQTLSGNNNFGGLTVDGGTLAVSRVTQLGTLTVGGSAAAPTAQVDVTGTMLVTAAVDGAATIAVGSTALATVRSLVAAGYHGGAWDGNGIVSSRAKTIPALAVGYAPLSSLRPAGAPAPRGTPAIPPQTIVIRMTLAGDATLDGVVNFDDLVALAQHYNTSGNYWFQGDFNYDGNVDFNDLVKLAQNYNRTLSDSLPAAGVPGAPAGFASDLAAAFASVPEPGGVAAAGVLALVGMRRRRAPAVYCGA